MAPIKSAVRARLVTIITELPNPAKETFDRTKLFENLRFRSEMAKAVCTVNNLYLCIKYLKNIKIPKPQYFLKKYYLIKNSSLFALAISYEQLNMTD